MTITEFLEARIAEDERHANGWCEDYSPCSVVSPGHKTPTRVNAECAAKRAIVGLAQSAGALVDFAAGYEGIEARILETLAAVYKDHPDYRQEWAL